MKRGWAIPQIGFGKSHSEKMSQHPKYILNPSSNHILTPKIPTESTNPHTLCLETRI